MDAAASARNAADSSSAAAWNHTMAQAEKQQLEDDAEAVNTFRHALHGAETLRTIAMSEANRDYENIAGPLGRAREAALAGAYAGAVARWAENIEDPTAALETALARAVADRVQAIAAIDNAYWQTWHNAGHDMVAATAPVEAAANNLIADADLAWVITMAPRQQTAWNRFTDAALGEVQSLAAVAVATNLTLIDNAAAWVGAVSGLTRAKLDAESQAGLDYVNTLAPQLRGQYDAISSAALGYDLAMIPVAKQTNDTLADHTAAHVNAAVSAFEDFLNTESDAYQTWTDAVIPAARQMSDASSTNSLSHAQATNQAAQQSASTHVNNALGWLGSVISAGQDAAFQAADNAQSAALSVASALASHANHVGEVLNAWSMAVFAAAQAGTSGVTGSQLASSGSFELNVPGAPPVPILPPLDEIDPAGPLPAPWAPSLPHTVIYDHDAKVNERMASPWGTIHGLTWAQLVEDARARVEKHGLINELTLAGHGHVGVASLMEIRLEHSDFYFQKEPQMTALAQLADLLADGATLRFVTCDSGHGQPGALLKSDIEEFFRSKGMNVNVILYDGTVRFNYWQIVEGDPWWEPFFQWWQQR